METVKRKRAPKFKISDATIEKLSPIFKQFDDEFMGVMKFKKDDVIDMLLSLRGDALSEKEILQIRTQKLSPVARVKWLLKQVEKGAAHNVELDLQSLVKQIQSPHEGSRTPPKQKQ